MFEDTDIVAWIVRVLEGYMCIEEIWNEKNDNIFLKDNPESSGSLEPKPLVSSEAYGSHNIEPNGSQKPKSLISSEVNESHKVEPNGSEKPKPFVSLEAYNGIEQRQFTYLELAIATNGSSDTTNGTEWFQDHQQRKINFQEDYQPRRFTYQELTMATGELKRLGEDGCWCIFHVACILSAEALANERAKENIYSWHMPVHWKDAFFLDDHHQHKMYGSEYTSTLEFTEETTVYSYGVILLEMITGEEHLMI
ncbi:hypothetical protein GH714_009467 [Hevea brasiliensis]|uniref:Uncharacterized protein n=1 Tax=Hevea brasiliensis TaxID=3981 RepID=A0A6A6KZ46_HEVBR|nr:hypothetical protein GH714_009467 [Hevea brasiliensis]